MRLAFSSTKQAAAFALLLLLILLLPKLAGKKFLPPLEQSYASLSWGNGWPWIRHVIFEETNDIDIAFMGSSHMYRGIDTPYVQEELSRRLNRPAIVRTVAWGGAGFDALYFTAKALTEHRKVHMLVFYDEDNIKSQRNVQGTGWFQWAIDSGDLDGLSLAERARFYLVAVVGMPRNLLCLIRPNIPLDMAPSTKRYEQEIILHAPNPATRLGSMSAQVGYNWSSDGYEFAPFEPFKPQTRVRPEDFKVYSSATQNAFTFFDKPLPAWQVFFARKFVQLAHERGCRLVMLHLPTTREMRAPAIVERAFWPEKLDGSIPMLGIPSANLFQDLTDDDVRKLFSDWGHLNQNGMEYFTPLLTPALINIYDQDANH